MAKQESQRLNFVILSLSLCVLDEIVHEHTDGEIFMLLWHTDISGCKNKFPDRCNT